ncbi:MAG TPA: 5-(carboxyamino)imidazole ribonucleotide synthase [Chitinophagales bacterium]|nr:5-(carboxyamino)imidazole ribonucleotide synthase [Chitinophagales bacterium]HRK28010.1 5-(carboxyamino)imidazole ribonucleotide synthase [Chitinophagales bacterium]
MKKAGILGGGQLGRMLIQAGIDFDIEVHVLDPDAHAPCRHLAARFVCGSLQDYDTVYQFGKGLDLLTIEIEKVNTDALAKLASEGVAVYPQPDVIKLIQDKRTQKQFYQTHHIPTADFRLTDNQADIYQYAHFLPAFLKLGKDGYDGRGVMPLNSPADIQNAFDQPCVLEKTVPVYKELAVIVAKNVQGETAAFPAVELVFDPKYNLVDYLLQPARISPQTEYQAQQIALQVLKELNMVGILAVEMFLTPDGQILVNEVAPRPHNSGHQTIKANFTSQYEQHWRAILGLPLGNTDIKCPAAMLNLIGANGYNGVARYVGMDTVLQTPRAYIHLYGKQLTKPGRKMGHITLLDTDVNHLLSQVQRLKNAVQVVSGE